LPDRAAALGAFSKGRFPQNINKKTYFFNFCLEKTPSTIVGLHNTTAFSALKCRRGASKFEKAVQRWGIDYN
jgi:hypothetical protein